jgi:hypothetical protein
MPARISVPIDVHLITLGIESFRVVSRQVRVGRDSRTQLERVRAVQEVPPGVDRGAMALAIEAANRIFLPADIQFALRSCTVERVAAPQNREEIDEAGFFELARQFPARSAASVLVVGKFRGAELGGQAVEALGVCILKRLGPADSGKVLAHELGHLLNLEHVTRSGVDNYNLMYPSLRADDQLSQDQINTARTSNLVKRFGAAPP